MKLLNITHTMRKINTSYPNRVRYRLRCFNEETRRRFRGGR